ncbi:MAG: hypothetical protein LDL41_07040 [Coleofasciculus sp. S288]|nr:hypothetical protein [Coleofasciculus sp. S288]
MNSYQHLSDSSGLRVQKNLDGEETQHRWVNADARIDGDELNIGVSVNFLLC